MPHSEDDGSTRGPVRPGAGTDPAGGDLQSDEAWADAGAGNPPPPDAGAPDEDPTFEDPNDR
jgi:hypothetical protein